MNNTSPWKQICVKFIIYNILLSKFPLKYNIYMFFFYHILSKSHSMSISIFYFAKYLLVSIYWHDRCIISTTVSFNLSKIRNNILCLDNSKMFFNISVRGFKSSKYH